MSIPVVLKSFHSSVGSYGFVPLPASSDPHRQVVSAGEAAKHILACYVSHAQTLEALRQQKSGWKAWDELRPDVAAEEFADNLRWNSLTVFPNPGHVAGKSKR